MGKELCFEENVGQFSSLDKNENISFILRAGTMTYFFEKDGYSIVQKNENGFGNRIDLIFEEEVTLTSGDPMEINSLFYSASKTKAIRTFKNIRYHDALQNFDLEFSIINGFLSKKIIANANFQNLTFSMQVEGAIQEDLSSSHGFSFQTSTGIYSELIQPSNTIHINALTTKNNSLENKIFSFSISKNSNTNSSQSSTLTWLTYLGGSSSDELFGIALANDSGAVVCGRTSSVNFPATVGAFQDTFSLNYDAVVTRFDKNGTCLWSTYYGGTNFDGAYQVISLDTAFVICGMTNSNDLPMLNPTQLNNAGSYDAFLLILNNAGQLVRSTYYGGTGSDQGLCIARGVNNEIVLAGATTSTNLPFTSTGYQSVMAGLIDAFVTVFNGTLNVQWSSYYGGNGVEDIHAVTVTPLNQIAFTGGTRSFDFPVTPNAYQAGLLSQPDNYIVKFNMSGARLYATFFGGTNNEDANGILGDENGNLYITGLTYSADFPTAGTIFQSTISGQDDIYVARFDYTGQLVWSTFVGGVGQDDGWGMYRLGKYLFICGETDSPDFPVSAIAMQSTISLNGDGVVFKMDTTGQMVSGTFFGGNGVDAMLAIVVDADTNIIGCGDTYSTNLPVTANPYQGTNASNGDGFVVKFGMSEELISTGVVQVNSDFSVSIFPNPVKSNLFISSEEYLISFEVLDAQGRTIKHQFTNSLTSSLDVADLESGLYFIKLIDKSGEVKVLSFVKQ